MDLIGILVFVIVVLLLFWAVRALMGAFGVGDPIATVVQVILVVFVILYLVSALGYGGGLLTVHHR